MNCLDSSAVIDYLEGVDAVGEFLDARDTRPYFAPTVVLHEVFVGAARLHGQDGVERVRNDLDWVEPLPLSVDAAAEAAVVDAQLQENGDAIGAIDTVIAGTVRDVGGTLVTGDDHFERVPGLDVENYRQ